MSKIMQWSPPSRPILTNSEEVDHWLSRAEDNFKEDGFLLSYLCLFWWADCLLTPDGEKPSCKIPYHDGSVAAKSMRHC
jgi:hypothetical protein